MGKNDLDTLKELAQVVTRNKVKSINVLSKKGPESKIYDFYEHLLNDSFASDQEAAQYFYNEDLHYPQYRKLKGKLTEKLINTSFFIDSNSPKFNTHQKAFYTCQRNLMAVRILLARYARKSAISIALDTVKKADKYEFSEISAELYKLLRNHYASHEHNRSRYRKYTELHRKYRDTALAEDLVFEMYDSTSIMMPKVSLNRNTIIKNCLRYQTQLKPLLKKHQSFRLHLWYYFLMLRLETLQNDYHGIIALCDKAINFFKEKPFISDQFIGAFYYHKLRSVIQIRDFTLGQSLALKCTSIFEESTIRWYTAQGYYFIFNMHSHHYRKGLLVRERVVNSKAFGQFLTIHESWHLFDSYLYFLALMKKISLPKQSSVSKFRIRKFLNEVPEFSTDKSGNNIPILIIQILIQIQQKKYDQLTDKIEAIEKYTSRYLRKDNNYRSNCFIKMLLQIPKQHFHRVAVQRHTKTLLSKLKAMPLEKANQSFEIEIIPYNDLWKMALESLG